MKNLIFTSLLLCFAISLSAQGKITMQAAPKNEKIMEKNTTFDIKKIDAEIETMAKEVKNNPLVKDWNTPFQTPPFNEIQNKHYMPAFEYAILLAKKDVANIINQKEEPNFENTIAALDRSGELLNRISGVFFNLLYSNTSAELQEISKKIQPKLTEYQNEISLNNELFKKVNIVYNQKAKLNSEQQMLLEKTYLSFVRNGAKLNPAQKKEYSELTMKLTMLNLEFSENVLAATNAFEMVFSSEKELAGIPQSALDIAAAKAEAKGKKGWLFDLSTPSYLAIMKYADNRDLRNKFFLRSASKCYKDGFDNTDVVYQIVRLRQEIANLLGYEDYASHAHEDRMAKDKKHVYNLIDELAKPSREAAEKEIASLEEFAHRHGLEGELQRWDVSYFSEKQKNEMFDFIKESIGIDEMISFGQESGTQIIYNFVEGMNETGIDNTIISDEIWAKFVAYKKYSKANTLETANPVPKNSNNIANFDSIICYTFNKTSYGSAFLFALCAYFIPELLILLFNFLNKSNERAEKRFMKRLIIMNGSIKPTDFMMVLSELIDKSKFYKKILLEIEDSNKKNYEENTKIYQKYIQQSKDLETKLFFEKLDEANNYDFDQAIINIKNEFNLDKRMQTRKVKKTVENIHVWGLVGFMALIVLIIMYLLMPWMTSYDLGSIM